MKSNCHPGLKRYFMFNQDLVGHENTSNEDTLYNNDYCHNIELFNTVTEQTLYSNDYCPTIELFNAVTTINNNKWL